MLMLLIVAFMLAGVFAPLIIPGGNEQIAPGQPLETIVGANEGSGP